MAKIDTLYLPFNGSSLDPLLQLTVVPPTSATETGGRLVVDSLASSVKAGVETVASYDWIASFFQIQVPYLTGTSPGSWLCYAAAGTLSGPCIRYQGSRPSAGGINASTGAYGQYAAGTTGRPYARIRELSGTVYWDESADGISWSSFYNSPLTNFGSLTNVKARLVTESASITTFELSQVGVTVGPTVEARQYYRQLSGLIYLGR